MHYAHDLDGREESSVPNPWGLLGARVISLVSQKGGVGKTTSTVNLGAAFALSGHRVLVIGADPQCGVSRSLGFAPEQLHGGLREVLLSGMPLSDVAHATSLDQLSMVVPDAWALDEERQYKDLMNRHADAFVEAVDEARAEWDTILIDCPPGFGPETRAALAASDAYLAPVQAEELCRDSLRRLLEFIAEYSTTLPSGGPLLEGLFMTMTDHRTLMSRHVAASLDTEFGTALLDHSVPRTTRLAEMALHGRPTVIYDRRSLGSRAYFDLVDELMLRWLKDSDSVARVSQKPLSPVTTDAVLPVAKAAAAAAGDSDSVFGSGGFRLDGDFDQDIDPQEEDDDMGGGLARLLRDITGGGAQPSADVVDSAPREAWASSGSDAEPDMVSLDELLDEEEGSSRERNSEGYWGLGDDDYDTIN